MKQVTAYFYKVRTGISFDELEVEGLRERFTEMQVDRTAIKNKKFIDNFVRCNERKFLRICKTMAAIGKHFICVHQVW